MKENEGMAVKSAESGDWNTSFLLALSAVRKKAAIFTDKSACVWNETSISYCFVILYKF